MLSKLKKSNNKGFTIIEVMIVLAIAGLILLIVFLAVPALQRNARNTSRKNDVASLLAAVNEYATNNNGSDPLTCSPAGGPSPYTFGTGTTSEAKVGYYTAGCGASATTTSDKVAILQMPASPATVAVPTNATTAPADYVNIYVGGQCDTTTTGKIDQGSARSVAAQYQIETGSGVYAEQCQST